MDKMDRKDRVKWIYESLDTQDLQERYDQWADEYDADLEEVFGWLGPKRAVEALARHVPQGARILDAGAGTGMVGELLARECYTELVAMDLSSGMLEKARNKNVYKELYQMVMGQPLGFPSDTFDAVISVGVLTVGHAPAGSLDELVRIVRPGGHIVFTLRPDVHRNSGFKQKQDSLESEGKWKLVEVSEPFQALPKGEPDVYHQVWVYRVLTP